MPTPRLLVVEGNTAEGRERQIAAGGVTASEGYARLIAELWPGAAVDICFPADPGANLPDGAGLESYDGVAITGSALHIYDGGPAIKPQIELARSVYRSKTPMFGSSNTTSYSTLWSRKAIVRGSQSMRRPASDSYS